MDQEKGRHALIFLQNTFMGIAIKYLRSAPKLSRFSSAAAEEAGPNCKSCSSCVRLNFPSLGEEEEEGDDPADSCKSIERDILICTLVIISICLKMQVTGI